jgi:putative transposase
LLAREGWRVNRKRVYRPWRQQGLKVPRKQRKKRRLVHSGNGRARRRAEYPGHVWAWDFVHDRAADGRPLKWLTVVDESTRECLPLEVGRGLTAGKAVARLAGVVRERGAPGGLRSDNGPEFIARALRGWLSAVGAQTLDVEPGAPWESGYAESFNSEGRDAFLAVEEFASLLEARVLGRQWQREYNHERPPSALGYRAPAAFASACPRAGGGSAEARRSRPADTLVTIDPTLTATGPRIGGKPARHAIR